HTRSCSWLGPRDRRRRGRAGPRGRPGAGWRSLRPSAAAGARFVGRQAGEAGSLSWLQPSRLGSWEEVSRLGRNFLVSALWNRCRPQFWGLLAASAARPPRKGHGILGWMSPSRKRTVRLVAALSAAVLLASALVYTSFSAASPALTPSQLVRK